MLNRNRRADGPAFMDMMSRIPTRSKRQAMEWSLALISQGITSTIERSEAGWGLVVNSEEHDSAVTTIERYRTENQHWPWRQKVREKILFDWGSLAWALLLGLFYWLDAERFPLRDAGLMNATAVSAGEWWRLFTAMFLHADAAHLAMNASIGLFLLGLAMGRYGTGIGLLAAFLAGAGGNVTTWLTFKTHLSLGASGMVMGCLGLVAAESVSGTPRPFPFKYLLGGLAGGGLLFVLLGLNPDSDVLAHLGGFVVGTIFGVILGRLPGLTRSTWANLVAGLVFSGLVLLTWGLVLIGP